MPRPPRRRDPVRRRGLLQALAIAPWAGLLTAAGLGGVPRPARAQGVTLTALDVSRRDGQLLLEFAVRLTLTRTVEDALQRGLPLYFVAEATVYRNRWYWRDERLARARRRWRIAFQPLTSTWRVNLGALGQSHATLADALNAVSASARWPIVDLDQLDRDASHYVRFEYALDTRQLPSPLQIDLGGRGDWTLRVEREIPVPPAP
jgi:hypothetical protein